jgi:hypothetical protein
VTAAGRSQLENGRVSGSSLTGCGEPQFRNPFLGTRGKMADSRYSLLAGGSVATGVSQQVAGLAEPPSSPKLERFLASVSWLTGFCPPL